MYARLIPSCFLFLALVALTSLVGIQHDPERFVKAYTDKVDAFRKTIVSGEVNYTLTFIPAELRLINLYKKELISEQEFQNALKQSRNEALQFELSIEIPANGMQEFLRYESDSLDYAQRIEYFAFGFKDDIQVQFDSEGSLPIQGYSFERNFGASPKGTIMLEVPNSRKADKLTFRFTDRAYGSDEHEITFEFKDINSLPKLKTIQHAK